MAQGKQDPKYSEEEYFQKADNLIHYSCPILRSLFCKRWEHTTGSPWNETSPENFITGIGKDFFNRAKPIQKEWLKRGKLEEWDITLLCNLLKYINWKVEDQETLFQQRKENQALEKLVIERNKTAHNSTKKLNEEGYNEVEKVVSSQLAELGLSESEIASIIQKAGILTSASGWAIAKVIYHKGNKKFKMGNYSRAIELYSEALQIPNLLHSKQAILLDMRATARVTLVEYIMEEGPEKSMNLKEAMLDITKSMEFGNDAWNVSLILGKIYKHRNELELAIGHFMSALELSPGQDEVKAELDCCKILKERFEQVNHSDSDEVKVTESESGTDCDKKSKSCKKEKVQKKRKDRSVREKPKWTGMAKNMDMDDLKQRADDGSITAQRLLQALYRQIQFEDLWKSGPPFTEEQCMQLVDDLYFCITNANWSVEMESALKMEVAQYMEALLRIHGHSKSELDRKLRICYVWARENSAQNIEVLKVGLERYPDDVYYYIFLSFMYTFAGDPKSALLTANLGLSIFPDHVELLFDKAYLIELILLHGGSCMEVRASSSGVTMVTPNIRVLYLRFIEQAPRDHFNVPEAYYALAATFIESKRLEIISAYYNRGVESEKFQLPCHLPYECNSKTIVERAIKEMQADSSVSPKEPVVKTTETSLTGLAEKPPMYSKLFTDDVWRMELIKGFREKIRYFRGQFAHKRAESVSSITVKSAEGPKSPSADLKSMRMVEFDDTKDRHLYKGCLINLTLIEDPVVVAFKPVHGIAHDENEDVTRIYFHNMTQECKLETQLIFGRRFTVINPIVRLNFNDRRPYIHVDDPASIIYRDEVINMCRYCWKENAPRNCSRCKWAKYCSRECQEKDWKMFGHKIICTSK